MTSQLPTDIPELFFDAATSRNVNKHRNFKNSSKLNNMGRPKKSTGKQTSNTMSSGGKSTSKTEEKRTSGRKRSQSRTDDSIIELGEIKSPNPKQRLTEDHRNVIESEKDSNNNATLSEESGTATKSKQNKSFIEELGEKSAKGKDNREHEETRKGFSVIADALRNPVFSRLDDEENLQNFEEELCSSGEEDSNAEFTYGMERRRRSRENEDEQRSRPRNRMSPQEKRSKRDRSPERETDLSSHPDPVVKRLMEELRQVKEQLQQNAKQMESEKKGKSSTPNQQFKSPSQTTIYAPAVKLKNTEHQ